MPFAFLILKFIHSKYFDTAANRLYNCFLKFYRFVYRLVVDTSRMAVAKEDITFKTIAFSSGEKQNTIEIEGANVIVTGSNGSHERGSSKIKLKNIVDYKWEVKNYNGRLVAVHMDGKYVAYAIKVGGKDGKIEGMVRVVNPTSSQRALIRGKSSEVLDLQFAHIKSQILLASIEISALHVHRIEEINGNILCTLQLKIEDPIVNYVPKYDKVNWCPFVPDSETENDDHAGKLLVWTRDASCQCINVSTVVEAHGLGTHRASSIKDETLRFEEESPITGTVLSPDGTTLAITFEDGEIRFYQVYFHINEDEPRLLHQWTPHGGRPVSDLFFLDDHSKCGAGNSLWKFAVTACDNNTEFKIWCCATWECKQTVRFESIDDKPMFFKAEIDPTSSYLVLTETGSRTLYILQLIQSTDEILRIDGEKSDDEPSDTNANGTKQFAFIKSIAQFPLSSPILSFGIVDAKVRKYKCACNDVYLLEELDDYDEDTMNRYCVVIHMFLVQPKSVQECHVLYQPTVAINAEVGSSFSGLSEDEMPRHNDELVSALKMKTEASMSSTMSSSIGSGIQIKGILESTTISGSGSSGEKIITKPPSSINLMTPDSFHSSGKITPEGVSNEVYSALRMLAGEKPVDNAALLHLVNNNNNNNNQPNEDSEKIPLLQHQSDDGHIDNNNVDIVPPMPPASMLSATGVSGGSSPSREVQEILSQKDSDINDFYDNSLEIQDDTDGSANGNGDAVDAKDEEKNSNQDDDETYSLNNVNDTVDQSTNGINKNDWPNAPTMIPLQNNESLYKKSVSSSPMNDINNKLDQMLEIIQSQTCQIFELRNEMAELKKTQSTAVASIAAAAVTGGSSTQNVEVKTQNMEIRLSRMIEEYLSRYEREHSKKLEAFASLREKQNREIRDAVFGMAPVLCNQMGIQLSQIMVTEVQKNLLPMVAAKLDTLKAQIQADVAQKISITDVVIKENIVNICKGKDLSDVFGNAVANGVRSGLQQTYVDSMKSFILPAYEKANAELFKQLHDTFNKGTIGYTNQMLAYTKMHEPIHTELVKLLRSVPEQLHSMNESNINACTQQSNAIKGELKAQQTQIMRTIRDNIKTEIKKGFEAQAASLEDSVLMAVRSQAQTPAPSVFDVQEQIKLLLQQGQINKAFHQALLANDLHLVEYTLERADFNLVFNPCPLEQTVLLSLIQQISADMSNHTETKQKYLNDSIMNLDLRDPITKEHAPKVLKELSTNCQNYVQANPQSPLGSSVRMLIRVVQSFGVNTAI